MSAKAAVVACLNIYKVNSAESKTFYLSYGQCICRSNVPCLYSIGKLENDNVKKERKFNVTVQ